MVTNQYLSWLRGTDSRWWSDSAEYDAVDQAIANGSTGVTTNPLLVKRALYGSPDFWRPRLSSARGLDGDEKAEEILRCVTVEIARKYQPIYEQTAGAQGYVCAQVNPKRQGDAGAMAEMGRRLAAWAPNIAVKLPATAAGLRAMETLAAEGVTTVGTVSFTVAQAVAVAAAQERGLARCRAEGRRPGAAFSVVMVGRLDDYLRDVIHDMEVPVPESDIRQAGTAVIRRAYRLFRARGYASKLMPAGMRGGYHAKALAGADMSMSLSANIQAALAGETDLRPHIDEDVPGEVLERLRTVPEFVRAYEPDALPPAAFLSFGASQRTLSQFVEAGWTPIAEFALS